MITLPSSLEKNQLLTFSLNKQELFSSVSDEYFSVEANVKKVIFIYKSSTGGQKKRIEFLISEASPSFSTVFSPKAKDVFELQKIVLMDYDGGTHVLPSTTVIESLRTISFTSGPVPSVVYFAFDGTSDNTLGGFGDENNSSIGGQFFN